MKDCKIKEIIENNVFCVVECEGDYEEVASAMKEYAEYYCEKFRQELIKDSYYLSAMEGEPVKVVEEIDIIQLKLPNHE